MTMEDANAYLFSGGSKSFPFAEVNDLVRGTIESAEVKQQTSIEGELLTWQDGSPRKQLVITLQTNLKDDDEDDGLRTIYAKGGKYDIQSGSGTSMRDAIVEAVKAAGGKAINVGDELAVCYSGIGKVKARGQSAPKLYEASYKVAQRAVSGRDLFGDE
jgi:hypothetical protein